MTSQTCKNCYKPVVGNYCSHCGDKLITSDNLSLNEISKEFVEEISSLDSKLILTLKTLLFKPGQLSIEFLEGKRGKYIRPIKLYLWLVVINVLIFTGIKKFDMYTVTNIQTIDPTGYLIQEINYYATLSGDSQSYLERLNQRFQDNLTIMGYTVVFLIALVLYAFFRKSKKYYLEHLVIGLHIMAFSIFRNILFSPILYFSKPIGLIAIFLTQIPYLVMVFRNVYGLSLQKAILTIVAFILCVGTVFISFIILSIDLTMRLSVYF